MIVPAGIILSAAGAKAADVSATAPNSMEEVVGLILTTVSSLSINGDEVSGTLDRKIVQRRRLDAKLAYAAFSVRHLKSINAAKQPMLHQVFWEVRRRPA
jgi:hypothetical protein